MYIVILCTSYLEKIFFPCTIFTYYLFLAVFRLFLVLASTGFSLHLFLLLSTGSSYVRLQQWQPAGSVTVTCDTSTQWLHGRWNLPRAGTRPVSPALAGGFLLPCHQGSPPRTIFKLTMQKKGQGSSLVV